MGQGGEWMAGLKRQYRRRMSVAVLLCVAAVALAVLLGLSAWRGAVGQLLAERTGRLVEQGEFLDARLGRWVRGVEEVASRLTTTAVVQFLVARDGADATTPEQDGELRAYLDDVLGLFSAEQGLSGARIVLADGSLLAGPGPDPASSQAWQGLRERCRERRALVLGSLHAGPDVPLVDVAAPVLVEDAAAGEDPAGYLFFRVPLKASFAEVLLPLPDGRGSMDISFVQPRPGAGGDAGMVLGTVSRHEDRVLFSETVLPEGWPVAEHVLLNLSPEGEEDGPYDFFSASTTPLEGFFRVSLSASDLRGAMARERRSIRTVVCGAVVILLLLLFAYQRYEMERNGRILGRRIEEQRFLLDSVNSSIGDGIALVTGHGVIRYANPSLDTLGAGCAGWHEKPVREFLPGRAADILMEGIDRALAEGGEHSAELELGEGEARRLYRVSLFPQDGTGVVGCVAIFKDITRFRRRALAEKERVRGLLDAFAVVVESLEKGQRGHTRKLLGVLDLLAQALGLSPEERATLLAAARMTPVCKIFIPRHILDKPVGLAPEEWKLVNSSPERTWELLCRCGVDRTVAAIVRDLAEKCDGSGPRGLRAEQISRPARILVAANAFCALVSPRSFRGAFSLEGALREMANDGRFDQDIVAVLRRLAVDDRGRLVAAVAGRDEDEAGSV